MLEILNCICCGEGWWEDFDKICVLVVGMELSFFCVLGQLMFGLVIVVLCYFEDEFVVYIEEWCCLVGLCKEFVLVCCMNVCLVGVDVLGYVSFVVEGWYVEVLEIYWECNLFVMICGCVCLVFCEQCCWCGDIDELVVICVVKCFMVDYEVIYFWMFFKVDVW